MPVYFQACKSASPLKSGVDMLPYSFSIAPFAVVAGATSTIFNRYKPQNFIGWCFVTVGMGLHVTLHESSALRNWVGFEIVAGIGLGLLVRASSSSVRVYRRLKPAIVHSNYFPNIGASSRLREC